MNKRLILPSFALLISGIAVGVLFMHYYGLGASSADNGQSRVVQSIQVGNPEYEVPAASLEAHTINSLFKNVARSVTPTVVAVYAGFRTPHNRQEQFEEEDLLDRFQRRPYRNSAGSGVIISEDGYVVTNNHVVEEAESIRVLLNDKREYEAEFIGSDPTTDLAVVRIEGEDLPVVSLGDSDNLEVGEWVVAVGNPFHLNSTVTQGIISATSRDVDIISGQFGIEDFIQTDAAINPGNSGGALVNLNGQLIGINTAIATERGSYEGYGFAVPVNLVIHVVNDLIAHGEVKRGFLGVTLEEVTAQTAEMIGLKTISGVLVGDVAGNGPASLAGVQSGDVIVAIDGQVIGAPNELQSRIARYRPGDVVNLDVVRDGTARSFSISLIDRNDVAIQRWINPQGGTDAPREDKEEPFMMPEPSPESPFQEMEDWGLVLRELTEEDRLQFNLADGAFIAYVRDESTAFADGLPRDAVITRIDDQPVHSVEDVLATLDLAYADEHPSVLFSVKRRDGIVSFYEVDVPSGE